MARTPGLVIALILSAFIVSSLAQPETSRSTVPGKSGRIAFESSYDEQHHILAHIENGLAPVTLIGGPDVAADPAWSPDGRYLAYRSDADGDAEIYVYDFLGLGQWKMTNNTSFDSDPSWSPDGLSIAYRSNVSGNPDINVASFPQGTIRNLVTSPSQDLDPDWSPSGEQLAFVSDRSGNKDIYTINLDGAGLTNLTNNPSTDSAPSWSPDAGHVAFASNRSGQFDVYTSDHRGSSLQKLTNSPATESEPSFSPDGEQIAYFASTVSGETNIYTMKSKDGSEVEEVVDLPGQQFSPSWQPLDTNKPQSQVTYPKPDRFNSIAPRRPSAAITARAENHRQQTKKAKNRSRQAVILRSIKGRATKSGQSRIRETQISIRLKYRGRCVELKRYGTYSRLLHCLSKPRFFTARGSTRFKARLSKRERLAIRKFIKRKGVKRQVGKKRRTIMRCEIRSRSVDTAGNTEQAIEIGRNLIRTWCRS